MMLRGMTTEYILPDIAAGRQTTAEAALQYRAAGFGPLPLPPGQKAPQSDQPDWLKRLSGLTGKKHARRLTEDDITANPEWWTGNIGIRLPKDVIGIDIDDHKPARPDGLTAWPRLLETIPELTELLETAPRATSRDISGRSGIYLFRLPEGYDEAEMSDPCDDVEIIRYGHRYAVAAPSEVDDRRYQWGGGRGRSGTTSRRRRHSHPPPPQKGRRGPRR